MGVESKTTELSLKIPYLRGAAMRWQPARMPDEVLFGIVGLFVAINVIWVLFQGTMSLVFLPLSVLLAFAFLVAHAVLLGQSYRASLQWFLLSVLLLITVIWLDFETCVYMLST